MKTRTAVVGGVFDSGFAALAAFASSIYASRVLETSMLGYYSLFLTAFLAATTIPGRLLFFPFEVAAVAREDSRFLAFVHRGLLRGLPLALTAGVAGALVAGLLARDAGQEAIMRMGVTMAAAASLSPLQDHVRRMLHVDGRSIQAALVSVAQLVAVLTFIVLFDLVGLDPLWIPYLSLAGGNAISLALGFIFIQIAAHGMREAPPPFRSIARSGSWLLYISLLGPVVGLALNAIVIAITDAATLGFAEAARQVGRPLLVVTTGLGMSLRPRSFAAAQRRELRKARRIERIAIGVTLLAGGAYAALVAVDWPVNVMAALIPKAYEISGLVLAVCLSNIVVGIAFPTGYELIGAGKESTSALVESIGQGFRLAVSAFAAPLGAFTIAASDTLVGGVRFVGYRLGVRHLYRQPAGEPLRQPAEGH